MSILDVAIIGAGISGINTAYRVQKARPDSKYTIFESRNEIGGTWSLFKYPGIRSDSDLFTFGFEWNHWPSDEVIADGPAILEYLDKSLKQFDGDKHLALKHKLISLNWSSSEQLWTLRFHVTTGNDYEKYEEKVVKSRWVVLGTGYYDYDEALPAEIAGLDNFKGTVIHPQFWPEDIDLTGKRVAIIGSGATAITILPNIIDKAAHVTLVQRSPSYIGVIPRTDSSAWFFKRLLPFSWATKILRVKFLVLSFLFVNFCLAFPNVARKLIARGVKKELPSNIPIDPHFTPRYLPWHQRFCLSPDGDLYEALRSGKAHVVTGTIENVTENSIHISDQPESTIDADVIITATGLKIKVGGGAQLSFDDVPFKPAEKMLWKGCMLRDTPNLVCVIGYVNASWTLGADVAAKTLTRMIELLRKTGSSSVTPIMPDGVRRRPAMMMSSTYLLKGKGEMPRSGSKYPWLGRRNYFVDMWDAMFGDVTKDMVSRSSLPVGDV
jgi:cation diffusion facilitator CzcD-associated flavoprotein CzcO